MAKPVFMGYTDPTVPGNWTEVGFIGNRLSVVDAGYLNQIREGNVPGHAYVHIHGHSHSVGLINQEISQLGTTAFGNWPAAAAGVILVSDNAADNAAGTGARTVTVYGLDNNWDEVSEVVPMDGITPTTITTQIFRRINELEVTTAGSGFVAAGEIIASISGTDIIAIGGDHHSTADPGRYTVPAGMTVYLENPEASGIGNKEVTIHIYTRDNTIADAPFLLRKTWHIKDGGYNPSGRLEPVTEKTDILFTAHAELAGATVSASIEGWIE